MAFRAVVLLLLPLFFMLASNLYLSPSWLGQSLIVKNNEIAELERRLSFISWPQEHLKIERQFSQALIAEMVANPFGSFAYARYADLYLSPDSGLGISENDAKFAFLSAFALANSRTEVKYYVASQCVIQSPSFKRLNVDLCARLNELMPQDVTLNVAANTLRVSVQDLSDALSAIGRCETPIKDPAVCSKLE